MRLSSLQSLQEETVFKQIAITLALLVTPAGLLAQAKPTASRAGDLQIGGGFSNANSDYLPNRINGGTVYFDFDFYHNLGLEGEFRFLKDGPSGIYEKTYQVGGRYSKTYRDRFQPYAKVMYGRGVFNFAENKITYANLAYNMVVFGGGLDYHLLRNVNVRGDFEYQKWMGFQPDGLTPTIFTIGAAYHFGAGRLSRGR
ncbi:MAG TPA: outer membrane beta-barrel protein [Edaphobacter sp.]